MTTFNRPSSFESIKDDIHQDEAAQIIELSKQVKAGKAALTDKKPDTKPRFETKLLADIVDTDYPELKQPVQGLIVEGVTLLVGAGKLGKSWMALQMCMSVAAGQPFLGRDTQQGSVLYLALEDSERRLKTRTERLSDCVNFGQEAYRNYLHIRTSAPTVDNGLMDMLEIWLTENEKPQLICIDVMQIVRGAGAKGSGQSNAYQADYNYLSPFTMFAKKHHIAVVLLHHVNKRTDKESSDPFDKISGSNGLMSAADTTLMLTRQRGQKQITIQFVSRDIYGDDIIINIDNGFLSVISQQGAEYLEKQDYDNNELVILIKEILKDNPGGASMSYVDFMKESEKRFGRYVISSPRAAAIAIKKMADDLSLYDNITVETGINFGDYKGLRIMKKVPYLTGQWSTQLPINI